VHDTKAKKQILVHGTKAKKQILVHGTKAKKQTTRYGSKKERRSFFETTITPSSSCLQVYYFFFFNHKKEKTNKLASSETDQCFRRSKYLFAKRFSFLTIFFYGLRGRHDPARRDRFRGQREMEAKSEGRKNW